MDMSLAGLSFAALMAAQLLAVIAVRQMRPGDDHSSTEGLVRKPRQPDPPSILVPSGSGSQTLNRGAILFGGCADRCRHRHRAGAAPPEFDRHVLSEKLQEHE